MNGKAVFIVDKSNQKGIQSNIMLLIWQADNIVLQLITHTHSNSSQTSSSLHPPSFHPVALSRFCNPWV